MNDIMSPSEQRESADLIADLRWERRQQRKARRRAFADWLLAIPATAVLRLGA